MKKIIITITLLAFFNLIGCYYQEHMNPGNYNFDEMEDVQITTKDTTYFLGENDYYFESDTLFATLSKKTDKQTILKTNVEIPVENIKSVEVERTNVLGTIGVILGILIGMLGALVLITYGN